MSQQIFLEKLHLLTIGSGNKALKERDQVSALINLRIAKQEEEQISLISSPDLWTVTFSHLDLQCSSRRPGENAEHICSFM